MNTTNTIPYILERIITLANTAYTGALDVGPIIGLKQNDAPTLLARIQVVIGAPPAVPGGDPIPGTVARYDQAITAVITANAVHREALAAARIYCSEAIDFLRRFLGRRWNSKWSAAGFTASSLAVAMNPETMLHRVRSYLGAHPEHSKPDLGISVAGVQLQLDAIDSTRRAAKARLADRVLAKENRDQSIEVLRQALSGLRSELDQLLDADDERWYQFGFDRPSDGRMPGTVKALTLRQGLPGEIVANWSRAELATGYRLSWRLNTPGATPVEVGLLADRAAIITGLPSGQAVVVAITARNSTGESAVTEATIGVS